jgi:membrane protease subunit HflK
LETLEEILQNANKVIIDTKQGSGVIPYLPLPEIKKRKRKQEKEENKETNVTNEEDVKNVQ